MITRSQHPPTDLLQPTLQQPLRTFMLPLLAPRALLALRQACSAAQQLVDETTADVWAAVAMRFGIHHQQLPTGPWYVHGVHAALHQQAALASRIRRWDASPVQQHHGLLDALSSGVQLRLT